MTFRLGGYGIDYTGDPEAYARAHVEFGYNAAYMPNISIENREEIAGIVKAMAAADVIIAEGGAWRNLIAHDDDKRKANLDYAVHQLALADELGARACVAFHGTVGHPGDPWQLSDNYDYGPHPDNQTEAGFQRAVDTARYVIDAVKPKRCQVLARDGALAGDRYGRELPQASESDRPPAVRRPCRCREHGDHAAAVLQQRPHDPRGFRAAGAVDRFLPRQGHRDAGRAGNDLLPSRRGAAGRGQSRLRRLYHRDRQSWGARCR